MTPRTLIQALLTFASVVAIGVAWSYDSTWGVFAGFCGLIAAMILL